MTESEILDLLLSSDTILSERLKKVVHLREIEKRTFGYIATEMRISYTRARQLYFQALEKFKKYETNLETIILELPVQIRNILLRYNLTKKSHLIEAIKNGTLHPSVTRGYGWISHRRVCALVGLPEPRKK